jgi:hypothetical protein
VRIRQYVYFALSSQTVTAAEVTGELGLEPDQVKVRGSRRSSPAIPVLHSWQIECDERGLDVDELITRVLDRVRPYADRIARLVMGRDLDATLQIVRDFDAEDGEAEVLDDTLLPDGTVLSKFPGQHQLLGWHLDADTMRLLLTMHAEVDCDEYGG